MCSLDQAPTGKPFVIVAIPDPEVRAQAIRVGFGVGARAAVQSAVPGGPIVLRRGFQEIALGRFLARRIQVTLCTEAT